MIIMDDRLLVLHAQNLLCLFDAVTCQAKSDFMIFFINNTYDIALLEFPNNFCYPNGQQALRFVGMKNCLCSIVDHYFTFWLLISVRHILLEVRRNFFGGEFCADLFSPYHL